MMDNEKVKALKARRKKLELLLTSNCFTNYGKIVKEIREIDKALYPDIKIYQDVLADPEIALLKLKGKIETAEKGIIFCPYIKPNIFKRAWQRIKRIFIKPKIEDL